MKRLSISTVLLLLVLLPTLGQKEVFFSSIPKDSIKVESLHGIRFGTGIDFLSLIQNLIANDRSHSASLGISYFNEKRIAPSWTLTTSVGLSNSVYNHIIWVPYENSNTSYISTDNYKLDYMLGLGIGIESRWYFGYKSRYELGKALLNSGWYLSLPISAATTLINTYKTNRSSNYINYIGFGGSLNLGYRRAISKQWFLEGNVSLLGISTSLYSLNKKLNLSPPYISYPTGIGLSAAYTFK